MLLFILLISVVVLNEAGEIFTLRNYSTIIHAGPLNNYLLEIVACVTHSINRPSLYMKGPELRSEDQQWSSGNHSIVTAGKVTRIIDF